MRALIVTSEVTFVPDNYAGFIAPLATHPSVHGLLLLENLDLSVVLQGLGLIVTGAAPRVGRSLLRNAFRAPGADARLAAFRAAGKPVFRLPSINVPAALELIREERIDLVLNARTRYIYRAPVLAAPRWGCYNIHHGLLPDQRGLMCDLWALGEGKPAGFSLHRMSAKLDDGEIVTAVPVSDGTDRVYVDYLARAARRESVAAGEFLDRMAHEGHVPCLPNARTTTTRYRRNPQLADLRKMRAKGLRL
jgi:methionyl-tRNA formyltransferase